MLLSAVLTLGVAIAVWLTVRDDPSEKGFESYAAATLTRAKRFSEILSGLKQVFRYANTWMLLVIPGGIVGCVLTFSGLWGVPYLTTHYGMPDTEAAAVSSALLVAWAIGGPVFGGLSDRLGLRKRPYVAGCTVAVSGWGVLLFVHRLPVPVLIGVILVTGFASGCMIISFAFAKESVPPHLTGTISGLINMGIMLGPTLLQPAVGWMLDRHWQGMVIDEVRIYGLGAYRAGFALMFAWAVLSFALLLFTRETHCRQMAPAETQDRTGRSIS
jgi:MFS family permease